ncbi:MAG: penicillin-binding protein 1C [Rubrivivax sp.]|nr:penicillin-binding protein 1C [Rubrivivax sp.]
MVFVAASLPLLSAPATAQALPSFEAVRAAHAPSDVPLLARDGTPLHWVRTETSVRRGPWLSLADISPALRGAIVYSEDQRFWQHGGIDWRAVAASAWANAWNTQTRGASTLTMQLAGLNDDTLRRPAGGRSIGQKLTQAWRAQQLEARWSKAQILEAYLNRVPLRGEVVGVAAASLLLFGKHASGLDAEEAALLAALVRAPNAAPALVEHRACDVLRAQQLGCDSLAITWSQALARRPGALHAGSGEALAPHLAQRLARAQPKAAAGQPLRSTLDAGVQRVALAALRRQLSELRGREVEDGAVLVLDNRSGEVLAWVGSAGPQQSSAAAVDAVLARRQPGSTLKPFVYAQALQQRLITAASVLDDAPLQLSSESGDGRAGGASLYQPQNYDRAFKGAVGVRTALASSLNVPAVRLGALLGPDTVFETLVRTGLRPSESAGYHGHALALGSADVTLLDLANAYRTLANGGRRTALRWQPDAALAPGAARDVPAVKVFDPAVAFIVADILADPAARATTFGLDSPLVTRGWAAVKTGTSKDLRDNWCLGFTDRYTVGVWVGNASGAPMHGVSGVSGAAPVWREVVAHLHAGVPSRAPAPPPGVVAQGGEWFVAGTAPTPASGGVAAAATRRAQPFGITSPRDGSLFVLDPDIPMAAQHLVFEGAPGRWLLDGRALGVGTQLRWLPRPGRHVLVRHAVGAAGNEGSNERIEFEVRAAAPPQRAQAGRFTPTSR